MLQLCAERAAPMLAAGCVCQSLRGLGAGCVVCWAAVALRRRQADTQKTSRLTAADSTRRRAESQYAVLKHSQTTHRFDSRLWTLDLLSLACQAPNVDAWVSCLSCFLTLAGDCLFEGFCDTLTTVSVICGCTQMTLICIKIYPLDTKPAVKE